MFVLSVCLFIGACLARMVHQTKQHTESSAVTETVCPARAGIEDRDPNSTSLLFVVWVSSPADCAHVVREALLTLW